MSSGYYKSKFDEIEELKERERKHRENDVDDAMDRLWQNEDQNEQTLREYEVDRANHLPVGQELRRQKGIDEVERQRDRNLVAKDMQKPEVFARPQGAHKPATVRAEKISELAPPKLPVVQNGAASVANQPAPWEKHGVSGSVVALGSKVNETLGRPAPEPRSIPQPSRIPDPAAEEPTQTYFAATSIPEPTTQPPAPLQMEETAAVPSPSIETVIRRYGPKRSEVVSGEGAVVVMRHEDEKTVPDKK